MRNDLYPDVVRSGLRCLPVCLLLACALAGAGGKQGTAPEPAPFNYRAPAPAELAEVQSRWAQRDLAPRHVTVVHQSRESAYQVTIYRHQLGQNTHYGALIIPDKPITRKLPVLILLTGLNQRDPTLPLERPLRSFRSDAITLVPVFRGRTLTYKGFSFRADGDFCDAYDGATDDAIAFLNVVAANTSTADLGNVVVSGYSRGANVALLMAERDRRVRSVIAGAGPTDFYREDVRSHYGSQYLCQFNIGMTDAQARQRMLASSPLRFPLLKSVGMVHLFQGEQDDVVPPWNSRDMQSTLTAQGVDVRYHGFPGDHDTTRTNATFAREWEAVHQAAIGSHAVPSHSTTN